MATEGSRESPAEPSRAGNGQGAGMFGKVLKKVLEGSAEGRGKC